MTRGAWPLQAGRSPRSFIGALAPTRKSELARFGLKAVAAGTMANFMSACIAGMLL